MKKTIYNMICAVCLAGTMAGCADFLEIKPQSEIIAEDFWNEKADVDAVIAGCYAGLESDAAIRRMMMWGEFRSENVMAGSGSGDDLDLTNVFKENITAKNAYTSWDIFYRVINRCNTVIKYAPEVAAIDPGYTNSELKATIAEATALRALCYFYLIRTFRNVPYVTDAITDDDQEVEIAATDFYTVLNRLITDLESIKGDAIARYPENKTNYQTGRITRDAINAMLCEMYLWNKDYTNCINRAEDVIASKKAYDEENNKKTGTISTSSDRLNGYPLEDNAISTGYFGSAFNNIFVTGGSKETIFELVFDNTEAGYSMLSNSAAGLWYGNSNVVQGRVAPSNYVLEDKAKETSRGVFADENKKMDARMYYNFSSSYECIYKMVYRGCMINATGTTPSVASSAKYNYAKINNVEHWYTSSNWIIYRLSDIMLLEAEAICQQMQEGSTAEIVAYNQPLIRKIFNLVNAVNKRSVCQTNLTDTLVLNLNATKSQMETLTLRERQRELMFEGKRWYDLVRRSLRDGNTQELISAVGHRDGPNAQLMQNFFGNASKWEWAIFWPYNYDETVVNKKLVQNPAFGDGMSSSIK